MLQRQTCVFASHTRLDYIGGQPGQLRDPAGLSSVDPLSGGDLGDRSVFAFIEEPLPVMRQTRRPDQGRVPRRLSLPTLCSGLDLELLWRVQWREYLFSWCWPKNKGPDHGVPAMCRASADKLLKNRSSYLKAPSPGRKPSSSLSVSLSAQDGCG